MTSTDPNRLTNGGARGSSAADRRIAPDAGAPALGGVESFGGVGPTGGVDRRTAPASAGFGSGTAPDRTGLHDAGRADGSGQTRRVRLAILDDHEVLLDSLSSWIAVNAYDFDLALTAHTWLEMVHSDSFPTDLVFLDFQLKEPVSIEARVRTCRAAGAKVIVLSSVDTRESRDRAVQAGAAAFLSKSLPMREVMDVAREVMGVARESAPQRDWRPLPTGAAGHQRPKLSHGEEEALRLYVSGFSTNEVAAQMNVQYETAKTYLRRVREKYGKVGRPASKKSDLIRRAAEDGYLA